MIEKANFFINIIKLLRVETSKLSNERDGLEAFGVQNHR